MGSDQPHWLTSEDHRCLRRNNRGQNTNPEDWTENCNLMSLRLIMFINCNKEFSKTKNKMWFSKYIIYNPTIGITLDQTFFFDNIKQSKLWLSLFRHLAYVVLYLSYYLAVCILKSNKQHVSIVFSKHNLMGAIFWSVWRWKIRMPVSLPRQL